MRDNSVKRELPGGYLLSDDLQRVDFKTVHQWLTDSYWTPGISREEVLRSARCSSVVVGAYGEGGKQVGYARAASDKTRFGYIMDVYVEEAHRGKGLGRSLVQFILDHPDHRLIFKWLLATKDAQGVYSKIGFKPLAEPERWLLMDRGWTRGSS